MKTGWRDAPLALRDSVVSNMHASANIKEHFRGIANCCDKILT